MGHHIRLGLGAFAAVAGATFTLAAAETADRIEPTAAYSLDRSLSGKRPGKTAKDLSGIACRAPDGSGSQLCAVVNDEGSLAQLVRLRGHNMTVGDLVRLIDDQPPDPAKVVGAPPEVPCPGGSAAFEEFDGEGVAYDAAEGRFYVVGSHGCSRKKSEFKLSSFLMARFTVGADGRAAMPELSYLLSGALRSADRIGGFFGKPHDAAAQGLNIEGIAVADGDLFVGLRAPSFNGEAFMLRAPIADLFPTGRTGATPRAQVLPVALRPNAGIRDLASLPDGRFLVLRGPAGAVCAFRSIVITDPDGR